MTKTWPVSMYGDRVPRFAVFDRALYTFVATPRGKVAAHRVDLSPFSAAVEGSLYGSLEEYVAAKQAPLRVGEVYSAMGGRPRRARRVRTRRAKRTPTTKGEQLQFGGKRQTRRTTKRLKRGTRKARP